MTGLHITLVLVATLAAFRGAVGASVASGRRDLRLDAPTEEPEPSRRALGQVISWTRRWPPPPRLIEALADAGVDAPAEAVWAMQLTALVAGPVIAAAAVGPGGAVAVAVLAALGPAAALRAMRGRGTARYEAGLAPALEALARSLRSGAGIRTALGEAGAGAPPGLQADLARVVSDSERGDGLVAALDAWAARRPLRGVALAATALTLGLEAGGAQARAVDGVAATMRQRARADAEAKALGAQARLSAGVIAVAPVAFAGLAAVLDPRTAEFLFRTGTGALFIAAGLTLDLLGAVWMARLARVAA